MKQAGLLAKTILDNMTHLDQLRDAVHKASYNHYKKLAFKRHLTVKTQHLEEHFMEYLEPVLASIQKDFAELIKTRSNLMAEVNLKLREIHQLKLDVALIRRQNEEEHREQSPDMAS